LLLLENLQNFVKIKDLFKNEVQHLKQAGIPEPELEVSLLLSHILNIDRTTLLLAGDQVLDDGQLEKFEISIARRLSREPLAYILEEKEFWSLPFKVSRNVLIPRPETELLIEITLKRMKSLVRCPEEQTINILDLGTGSGIIAVVLALELPESAVTAVDLSFKALKVAKHNATRHKVGARVQFINCDWFGGISSKMKYDLVLANPPYIARNILEKPFGETCESLQPEVLGYEPHLALDGGERGVESFRRIADDLGKTLKSGGWFFMEIGADQAEDISAIFKRTASYDNIAVHNDYAGLPRVFQAQKQ
jgi:release factor glutamine methyltransferase